MRGWLNRLPSWEDAFSKRDGEGERGHDLVGHAAMAASEPHTEV